MIYKEGEGPKSIFAKSEGWSVSQKEAIRTQLTIFAGVVSVEFIDGVDGGRLNLLVDETLEALEAITKGDEQ